MKQLNTRFNPTTNADLHIGHLLNILVNRHESQVSGGKFIIRFDDNQEIWNMRMNRSKINQVEENTILLMQALGITVTHYRSDNGLEEVISKYMESLGLKKYLPAQEMVMVNNSPDVVGKQYVAYPYHPYLTVKKVIADFIDEINLVIRGEDLLSEFSLYSYFCDIARIPQPVHVYIPRLRMKSGIEISKSHGATPLIKIIDKGVSAEEIMALLRVSSLKNIHGEFSIENLLPAPALDDDMYKRLITI